jgi:hypothetical protein
MTSNNLLTEAEVHLVSSQFIYLYSELRILSGAGYTPFAFEDCGGNERGVRNDSIFVSLLKSLRKEDMDDPEGL